MTSATKPEFVIVRTYDYRLGQDCYACATLIEPRSLVGVFKVLCPDGFCTAQRFHWECVLTDEMLTQAIGAAIRMHGSVEDLHDSFCHTKAVPEVLSALQAIAGRVGDANAPPTPAANSEVQNTILPQEPQTPRPPSHRRARRKRHAVVIVNNSPPQSVLGQFGTALGLISQRRGTILVSPPNGSPAPATTCGPIGCTTQPSTSGSLKDEHPQSPSDTDGPFFLTISSSSPRLSESPVLSSVSKVNNTFGRRSQATPPVATSRSRKSTRSRTRRPLLDEHPAKIRRTGDEGSVPVLLSPLRPRTPDSPVVEARERNRKRKRDF